MNAGSRAVCAIVGAGEGLGASLARVFAADGCDIALVSRTSAGSATAREAAAAANPSGRVLCVQADAAKTQSLEAALSQVAGELGPVDVLIYNVRGSIAFRPPLDVTCAELREILDVEVVGAFAATRAVLPSMIERRCGTILYSSATAALRGSATGLSYATAKFGLRGLAQSVAKAYAAQGVHVAHVRLDCALDVPIVRTMMGEDYKPELTANTDDVARSYLWVHHQPRSAWSNEIELRPFTENWTI
jgi:NAD(P)-dependent dehydrogenase (short-subunit alcohol dehydrogenase family)